MIGRTFGKYRILEKLGRGTTGTVYKAVDEMLAREVAIKMLNPEMSDTTVMARFEAEARSLAKLNHSEIALIHEIHRVDGNLLMVMELVRGETLEQLLQRTGLLLPDRAAYLMSQVLGALSHAHAASVVHGGLKPANVMVTTEGGIKILDFGMARVAAAEHITAVGPVTDAPAFMAPERLLGHDVDGRADVYSVGVLFYRLITGHLPYEADNPTDMVRRQLSEPFVPAHVYRPDLPEWCDRLLAGALAKSPTDRFATAHAFQTALLAAIAPTATEETGSFPQPPAPQPAVPDRTDAYRVSATDAAAAPDLADAETRIAIAPTPAPAGHGPLPVSSELTPAPLRTATPPPAPAGVPMPSAAAPAPTGATLVLERKHFAVAGTVLTLLVVGVLALVIIALRRNQPVAVAPDSGAAATQPAAPPPANPPGITAPPLEVSEPALRVGDPDTPADGRGRAAAGSGSPAAAPGASARNEPAARGTPPRGPESAPAIPSAPARPVAPPITFDARAVVVDGDKRREQDASVLLADGRITVAQKNDRILYLVPLEEIESVTYSNSRQPLWDSPNGPAEAMRVEGGAFGFLRGGRHWFGLRTKESLLVFRVEEGAVNRVIRALQDHTGLSVARLSEPKE